MPRPAGAARCDRIDARLADPGVHVRRHHIERDLATLGARLRKEPA